MPSAGCARMEQLLRGAQPRRILSVVLVRAQRRRPVNGGPPNHFADLFGGFCPPKKRRSTRSAVVRASRSPAKETADLQAGITAALIFELISFIEFPRRQRHDI